MAKGNIAAARRNMMLLMEERAKLSELSSQAMMSQLRADHLMAVRMIADRYSRKNWPLLVPPLVMRNDVRFFLDTNLPVSFEQYEPVNVLFAPSCCLAFSEQVQPAIAAKLQMYFERYWGYGSAHQIMFYNNCWVGAKVGDETTVRDIEALTGTTPSIVITPQVNDGKLFLSLSHWHLATTNVEASQHSCFEQMITLPIDGVNFSTDNYAESDVELIANEASQAIACLCGMYVDIYAWSRYHTAPLLPGLLARNAFDWGNKQLAETNKAYVELLKSSVASGVAVLGIHDKAIADFCVAVDKPFGTKHCLRSLPIFGSKLGKKFFAPLLPSTQACIIELLKQHNNHYCIDRKVINQLHADYAINLLVLAAYELIDASPNQLPFTNNDIYEEKEEFFLFDKADLRNQLFGMAKEAINSVFTDIHSTNASDWRAWARSRLCYRFKEPEMNLIASIMTEFKPRVKTWLNSRCDMVVDQCYANMKEQLSNILPNHDSVLHNAKKIVRNRYAEKIVDINTDEYIKNNADRFTSSREIWADRVAYERIYYSVFGSDHLRDTYSKASIGSYNRELRDDSILALLIMMRNFMGKTLDIKQHIVEPIEDDYTGGHIEWGREGDLPGWPRDV
ncbi:MAG: hypothetical protein ACI308_06235 [Muribaculaceae bacterium]